MEGNKTYSKLSESSNVGSDLYDRYRQIKNELPNKRLIKNLILLSLETAKKLKTLKLDNVGVTASCDILLLTPTHDECMSFIKPADDEEKIRLRHLAYKPSNLEMIMIIAIMENWRETDKRGFHKSPTGTSFPNYLSILHINDKEVRFMLNYRGWWSYQFTLKIKQFKAIMLLFDSIDYYLWYPTSLIPKWQELKVKLPLTSICGFPNVSLAGRHGFFSPHALISRKPTEITYEPFVVVRKKSENIMIVTDLGGNYIESPLSDLSEDILNNADRIYLLDPTIPLSDIFQITTPHNVLQTSHLSVYNLYPTRGFTTASRPFMVRGSPQKRYPTTEVNTIKYTQMFLSGEFSSSKYWNIIICGDVDASTDSSIIKVPCKYYEYYFAENGTLFIVIDSQYKEDGSFNEPLVLPGVNLLKFSSEKILSNFNSVRILPFVRDHFSVENNKNFEFANKLCCIVEVIYSFFSFATKNDQIGFFQFLRCYKKKSGEKMIYFALQRLAIQESIDENPHIKMLLGKAEVNEFIDKITNVEDEEMMGKNQDLLVMLKQNPIILQIKDGVGQINIRITRTSGGSKKASNNIVTQ